MTFPLLAPSKPTYAPETLPWLIGALLLSGLLFILGWIIIPVAILISIAVPVYIRLQRVEHGQPDLEEEVIGTLEITDRFVRTNQLHFDIAKLRRIRLELDGSRGRVRQPALYYRHHHYESGEAMLHLWRGKEVHTFRFVVQDRRHLERLRNIRDVWKQQGTLEVVILNG